MFTVTISPAARSLVFSDVRVFLPAGAQVLLTVCGEEASPIDLDDGLPQILFLGAGLPAPVNTQQTAARDFAVLEIPDGVRFFRAGRRVPSPLAGEWLSRGLVEVLRRATAF